MIKKIDIKKFGLFTDYVWDTAIGQTQDFRNQNIIYGRNYSGKTTLARIFKSIEDGKLHKNYLDCDFSVTLRGGKIITPTNLLDFGTDYKIRVYNTDFVNENLNWLYNDDGTIKPFTILGAKNVDLDRKIKGIEEKLGNVEEKGLLFDIEQKNKSFLLKKAQYDSKNKELNDKLKTKAQLIKNNATIFNYPTYQINTIKVDISNLTDKSVLTEELIDEKKKLLKEESKGNIEKLNESRPNFATYSTDTRELIERKIKTNQPIAELINKALLQEWVREGIEMHEDNKEKCAFCGNPIHQDLWTKLDAHFSKESEMLREELSSYVEKLEVAKQKLDGFITLEKEMFYTTLIPKYDTISKKWNGIAQLYSNAVAELISQVQLRQKDIFKDIIFQDVVDKSGDIFEIIKEFNILIDEHNSKTTTLSEDQKKARLELRFSEVGKFVNDIDYKNKMSEIEILSIENDKLKGEIFVQASEKNTLIEEKRLLEAQAKDESKGAELVNQHLTHFFGHDELKLVSHGISPNINFKIMRDGLDANNLSEGECSLISFCYFIAKMEDEMKDEQNNNKLLIYIDDPISSLDSNHIFFMFSLIESVIAKPKKYGQLFISTHNLEFLKYLKKLTSPIKYQRLPSVNAENGLQQFFIERKNKISTQIKLAPEYLKNYITEFNYLFSQIYKCSVSDVETITHDYQYSFGNNMRKFLEAYLFYKYPSHKFSFDQRINKFFNNESVSVALVNRVINEYSHLGEQFDRGLEPIDVEAMSKIAQTVIKRIETTDPDQYSALIESIVG